MTDDTKDGWKPCRKKPLVVHVREATEEERCGAFVPTREGLTLARPGNLIMRGVEGEVYPIGRDIFERTYDLLDESGETRDDKCSSAVHVWPGSVHVYGPGQFTGDERCQCRALQACEFSAEAGHAWAASRWGRVEADRLFPDRRLASPTPSTASDDPLTTSGLGWLRTGLTFVLDLPGDTANIEIVSEVARLKRAEIDEDEPRAAEYIRELREERAALRDRVKVLEVERDEARCEMAERASFTDMDNGARVYNVEAGHAWAMRRWGRAEADWLYQWRNNFNDAEAAAEVDHHDALDRENILRDRVRVLEAALTRIAAFCGAPGFGCVEVAEASLVEHGEPLDPYRRQTPPNEPSGAMLNEEKLQRIADEAADFEDKHGALVLIGPPSEPPGNNYACPCGKWVLSHAHGWAWGPPSAAHATPASDSETSP